MFAIEKTKNSAAGVPVLLAFTFFMGLMLSRLSVGARPDNGAGLIMTAFGGTGLVFFGMAALSTVIKRDLSAMGKFLFIGAIMVLVGAASPTSSLQSSVADDHALGAGDRHLLGLHPVRPASASSTAARPTTSAPRWRLPDLFNVFQSCCRSSA